MKSEKYNKYWIHTLSNTESASGAQTSYISKYKDARQMIGACISDEGKNNSIEKAKVKIDSY